MKEHTVTWYESEDGKIFQDECECLMHETQKLYEQCGIRFYKGRKLIKKLEPIHNDFCYEDTFDEATRMTIDRSKKDINDKFIETYSRLGCSCFIEEAYYGRIDGYGYVPYSAGSAKRDIAFYNGSKPVFGTEYVSTPNDLYGPDMICKKQLNVCPVCGEMKTLFPYNHRKDEWGNHSCEWICKECKQAN